jgi:glutathione S-transferase
VQYIADKAGATAILPKAGTKERYRAIEWLNFVTSELHKSFGPLFNDQVPDAYKTMVKDKLSQRFDMLERHFASNDHLLGKTFSVADAYLFTVLSWGKYVGIDIARWPAISAYHARVAARPAVQAALKAEGLVK